MKINSGQAPSTLIPEYLGSDFDKVVSVADNLEYVKQVAEGIAGMPSKSYTGPTPPTHPVMGSEWYCTTDGRTYIWYEDEDSSQWVESSPQSDVSAPPNKMTLNAAATDAATTTELVNQIRAGLIAIGLAK